MNQHKVNISLSQTTSVTCDKCNSSYFVQQIRLQKVPALLTGEPHPTYMPIPVFACAKCGHVNSEFDAQERQGLEIEE
jgi:hypothetical protein